jgi:hypothetical protein
LRVDNSSERTTWREWTSSSTKSRSISSNENAVWFNIESQSDRSLFDPNDSFVSIEFSISSGNGTDFTADDLIVCPNGYFWLREFTHLLNSKPAYRLLGGADKALTALSLVMDPKTTQSSNYFSVFPNANDLSANSVDPTNAAYNPVLDAINSRGIEEGSVATRKFSYTIPLSVLTWLARPTSDLNSALPDLEHEFRFDLHSRSDFANNIMFALISGASVDSSSFSIDKMTIWAKYLEPSPSTITYFTKNSFDERMMWLAPDHVVLRNRSDTRLTGERISSYSTMVNKVIVYALDAGQTQTDAENKTTTDDTYITNASVEFNGVRVYASETDSTQDRYMRNYLVASDYPVTSAAQAPLTYDDYRKSYKSLQVFDLSEISEKRLNMSNELYFSGDVKGGVNFDLHFVVIKHSYADVVFKDGELLIENTQGV